MYRHFQVSVPNHSTHQQSLMSNTPASDQWPPFNSPINPYWVQPDLCRVISPQFSAMCTPRNENMSPSSAFDMRSVWPPVHHPPTNLISMISANNMTIAQTGEWVRTLSRQNFWKEADEYADTFKKKKIMGHLLPKLTNEVLKKDLGIVKYGHRLQIMFAIMRLFPKTVVSEHFAEEKNFPKDKRQSPMLESMVESKSVESIASTLQKRSPSIQSMMVSTPPQGDLEPSEHKTDVVKWFGSQEKSTIAVSSSSRRDFTTNSKCKNIRAKPTNPRFYKTLRKVKLRAGKSGEAKVIGYLPKGSLVLINQIKGRRGRVVIQKENGRYKNLGWVSLLTEDKKQLLKKCNPSTNELGANSSFAPAISFRDTLFKM